jgi:hypothetical protein
MKDPIAKLIEGLIAQGVVFEIVMNELRWRAPRGIVSSEVARLLVDHAPIVVAILNPDITLPDILIIPCETTNDVASLAACIDTQTGSITQNVLSGGRFGHSTTE